MTDALKPCPFCGDTPTALNFCEGSTFRWLAWSCPSCGVGAEERVQTMGDGTPGQWLDDAKVLATEVWNNRAALAAPPGPHPLDLLQAGFNNAELLAQWRKKLPGVEPTDRELSAFAVGTEVGWQRSRDVERQDWDRVHHALAKHGKHPGRTDDHLADVIDRALAAAPDAPTDQSHPQR